MAYTDSSLHHTNDLIGCWIEHCNAIRRDVTNERIHFRLPLPYVTFSQLYLTNHGVHYLLLVEDQKLKAFTWKITIRDVSLL